MQNIDLNDIRLFVAVVQAGSLTKASELLAIPKSRLSRRLTELENALGTSLLDRGKRGVSLNEIGMTFFRQAQEMLSVAQRAVDGVQGNLTQPNGLVRVSVSNDIYHEFIAPHLGGFLRQYPDIRLDVQIHNEKINMIQDGFDLALRVGAIENENVVARKLTTLKVGIFAHKDYLNDYPPISHPSDLNRHPQLVKMHTPPWLFRHKDQQVQAAENRRVFCNYFHLVARLIDEKIGVGMLPHFHSLLRPDFVQLLPEWQLPETELSLIYYKNRSNIVAIKALMDYLLVQVR